MDEQQKIAEIHRHLIERYPMYTTNDAFEQWMFRQTGGDHTKVDEYLNLLSDYGYIDGEGTLTGDFTAVPEPAQVRADIERRLASLGSDVLDLLNVASVEGTHFSTDVLTALCRGDGDQIASRLRSAEAAGVVAHDGSDSLYATPSDRYRFVPLTTREILIERLPDDERARLHSTLVEFLGERLEETEEPGAREMLMEMIREHNRLGSRPDPSPSTEGRKL